MKGHVPGPRPAGRQRKPRKVRYAWAGFVNGRIDDWLSGFYDIEHLAIFKTKREALNCHEEVRRVKITLA